MGEKEKGAATTNGQVSFESMKLKSVDGKLRLDLCDLDDPLYAVSLPARPAKHPRKISSHRRLGRCRTQPADDVPRPELCSGWMDRVSYRLRRQDIFDLPLRVNC